MKFLKNIWPVVLGAIGLLLMWIGVKRSEKKTIEGTVENERTQEDVNEADRIDNAIDRLP